MELNEIKTYFDAEQTIEKAEQEYMPTELNAQIIELGQALDSWKTKMKGIEDSLKFKKRADNETIDNLISLHYLIKAGTKKINELLYKIELSPKGYKL